jgi:hypothetical protein
MEHLVCHGGGASVNGGLVSWDMVTSTGFQVGPYKRCDSR